MKIRFQLITWFILKTRLLSTRATTNLNHFSKRLLMSSSSQSRNIVIDPFCLRQFTDPNFAGAKINYSVEGFESKINEHLENGYQLREGYAPFCKHMFLPNFAKIEGYIVPITAQNEHLLKTSYDARTPLELPVLSRWFQRGTVASPSAEFIDVILYSREQIRKENESMGKQDSSDAPWGAISVKAQNVDFEIPMQPITMLRNALGKHEGGSGVPLDREKYLKSVEFWSCHAVIR